MSAPLTGACLCGACSFTAVPDMTHGAGVCHCSMCRKWSGGIFISVACNDSLRFAEGAPLTVYDSSPWGVRVSCACCGSSIAWRSKDGKANQVSVQMFDDPAQFPVKTEIFIDDKPDSYALDCQTQKLTGAEVMAMFAPKPDGKG